MKLITLRVALTFLLMFLSSFAWAISTGTSFAVTKDGVLLTNYHVIENSKTVIVRSNDMQFFYAEVIKYDQEADIAFLKIKSPTPNFLSASRSESIKKGEKVYALGFPHIDLQGGESKITEGIISSLSGYQGDPSLFQISAAIQGGNSGGPLIRADGTVIGIVSAKLSAAKTLKLTGDLPQNVNYAIKISEASHLSPIYIQYLQKKLHNQKSAEKIIEQADRSLFLVIASNYIAQPHLSEGLIRPYIKMPQIFEKKFDLSSPNVGKTQQHQSEINSQNELTPSAFATKNESGGLNEKRASQLEKHVAEYDRLGLKVEMLDDYLTVIGISPYIKSSFKVGDKIVSNVGGKRLYTIDDYNQNVNNINVVFKTKAGEKKQVVFNILRDGVENYASVLID